MKGLFRALSTGVVAIAIAGAGFPSLLVARAANTAPVITSITFTPDGVTQLVSEGDVVRVDVTFTDPDADMELITVSWSDSSTNAFTLMNGERSFFVDRKFADDFPTATPVDGVTFTVVIEDSANPAVRSSATLTIHNVAPVFTAFTVTPAAILPNQSVTAAGSFSDVGTSDSFTLAVDWGDGSTKSGQAFGSRAVKEFSFPHLYDRGGSFTVTATVTDDDTGVGTATAPVIVTAPNTAPSDLSATAGPALEGGNATIAVRFVDPDAGDVHTVSLDWGDGSASQSLALPAGVTSTSPTHVYQDSGAYNAIVKVADSAASTEPVTVVVTVANVGPTVTAENLSAPSILEQESVTVDATFVDPGMSDTFTLTMEWGDGSSWSTDLAAGAHAASASHQYLAAGPFVITVTVKDSDNATGSMAKPLDVRARNRAPIDLKLTVPSSPRAGSPASLTGVFTDPDTSDAHTITVGWGDTKTETQSLGAGVGSFTATHTYATNGTYHVTVTVTDPAGLWTSQTVDLVVQKKRDNNECDQLVALEQRYAWLHDHDTQGLLARAVAYLSSRFGCDDDDGDHRASAIRTQVTVNATIKLSETRRPETGQSDNREGRRTER